MLLAALGCSKRRRACSAVKSHCFDYVLVLHSIYSVLLDIKCKISTTMGLQNGESYWFLQTFHLAQKGKTLTTFMSTLHTFVQHSCATLSYIFWLSILFLLFSCIFTVPTVSISVEDFLLSNMKCCFIITVLRCHNFWRKFLLLLDIPSFLA